MIAKTRKVQKQTEDLIVSGYVIATWLPSDRWHVWTGTVSMSRSEAIVRYLRMIGLSKSTDKSRKEAWQEQRRVTGARTRKITMKVHQL